MDTFYDARLQFVQLLIIFENFVFCELEALRQKRSWNFKAMCARKYINKIFFLGWLLFKHTHLLTVKCMKKLCIHFLWKIFLIISTSPHSISGSTMTLRFVCHTHCASKKSFFLFIISVWIKPTKKCRPKAANFHPNQHTATIRENRSSDLSLTLKNWKN